jgi:predicted acylesterase/phospholipase RssA
MRAPKDLTRTTEPDAAESSPVPESWEGRAGPVRALVLSGGGLFGAWQAGAWAALAPAFQPDLIVGASVGSLNGYAIACGATPQDLRELWLREDVASLHRLEASLRLLTHGRHPQVDYAVVVTDLLRLKPRIFRGREVTWKHLAASCAVPLVFPPVRIDGRFYLDGGLLNPLPVYAAVKLGATQILALQALPEIPSLLLKPFVLGFRGVFGVHPHLPAGVQLTVLEPGRRLGSLRDALRWKRENVERWLEQGRTDAQGCHEAIAAGSAAQKTFPL